MTAIAAAAKCSWVPLRCRPAAIELFIFVLAIPGEPTSPQARACCHERHDMEGLTGCRWCSRPVGAGAGTHYRVGMDESASTSQNRESKGSKRVTQAVHLPWQGSASPLYSGGDEDGSKRLLTPRPTRVSVSAREATWSEVPRRAWARVTSWCGNW